MRNANDWSMEQEAIDIIVAWIQEHDPKVVVELGSGDSTWKLAPHISGVLYSYEGNKEWFNRTKSLGRAGNVKLIYAPYADGWYSGEFPDKIDLLIVDGPEGSIGRAPAVPRLRAKLRGPVFLHDTIRPAEIAIAKEWGKPTFYNTPFGLALIEL